MTCCLPVHFHIRLEFRHCVIENSKSSPTHRRDRECDYTTHYTAAAACVCVENLTVLLYSALSVSISGEEELREFNGVVI